MATCRMLTGRHVHCHFVFRSHTGGVTTGISGTLAKRVGLVRGATGRDVSREVPMEPSASRDRPMPLTTQPAGHDTAPAAYHDGIRAIVEIAAQFTRASWNAPTPCPEWRAADLAGHLRCIIDDYHEYLDDAPVSRL